MRDFSCAALQIVPLFNCVRLQPLLLGAIWGATSLLSLQYSIIFIVLYRHCGSRYPLHRSRASARAALFLPYLNEKGRLDGSAAGCLLTPLLPPNGGKLCPNNRSNSAAASTIFVPGPKIATVPTDFRKS